MNFRKNVVRLVLGLAGIGTCLAGAVYFTTKSQSTQFIKDDTKNEATEWTELLQKNVPDIGAIIGGVKPEGQSLTYMRFASHANGLDRFDLYDAQGKLSLRSEELGDLRATDLDTAEADQVAKDVLNTGQPLVSLLPVQRDGETLTMARTYMPVEHDGKVIGVAEIDMDKSDIVATLGEKFTVASMIASGLTAFGFAIPAAAVMLQLRRRREADAQVAFLANHDVVTGVPNRRAAERDLQKFLDAVNQPSRTTMVHFIDMDYFKDINDRFGHSFGDELLRAFADRLKDQVKIGGMVARFGGDEFLLVQSGFRSKEDVEAAIRHLMNVLAQPYEILGKSVVVTASIGTAIFPPEGASAEETLANADTALYAVKLSGRNGHRFFVPEMRSQKRRRAELERLIRKHSSARSFELHFQPLYQLSGAKLKGFEALLRMLDENGKYVPPVEFIPVAEEMGLIDDIGSWVIEEACRQAKEWPDDLQVAVNLSAVQFRRKSVCRAVGGAIRRTNFDAKRLLLEVTESLLMSDVDGVLEQLAELRKMGVCLAMDDFGTGYSSLSYMIRFPFDRIKIDRSFVKELATDGAAARKVIQTIVALGHNMNMTVTAEGVETMEQAAELRSMSCDDAQGYLFSKPVPAADVAAIILKDFAGQRSAGVPRAASVSKVKSARSR